LGVDVSEVFNTLQADLGSFYVNDFNQFGRTWHLKVQVEPRFRENGFELLNLQVKNRQNQPIRLGAVLEVRDAAAPPVIERHNMYPIARVSANLMEGVSLAEAKALCESLAEQEFAGKQLKLVWPASDR
jgi:multidrug efflux pump